MLIGSDSSVMVHCILFTALEQPESSGSAIASGDRPRSKMPWLMKAEPDSRVIKDKDVKARSPRSRSWPY